MLLVTGFPKPLSRRMAQAILARTPDMPLALLVHEPDAEAARQQFGEGARVLTGDAASMHLGLSTGEYQELTRNCTDIIHAAGSDRLDEDRATLDRLNLEGTRAILELAHDCRKLRRLTHFSTVFVSGDRRGVIAEDELSAGQTFRNAWEQACFEAEILVRRAMGQLPCSVLRPSMIWGQSETDPLEGPCALAILMVTSPLAVPLPLPGDGIAPLQLVPVDFVTEAAAAIHGDPRAVGRTFHLVDPNPSSVRRVYEMVAQRAGKNLPRLSLGSRLTDAFFRLPGMERLTREQRISMACVDQLAFYGSRNTQELLEGTGVRCPPIESSIDKLIAFARARLRPPEKAEPP